jgi:tetratricopeptide (TPR) repeat protein
MIEEISKLIVNGNFDEAEQEIKKLSETEIIAANLLYSHLYKEKGKYHDALNHAKQALEASNKKNDEFNIISSHVEISHINSKLGNSKEVMLHTDQALKIYNQVDDKEKVKFYKVMATLYNQRGISYSNLGDLENAMTEFEESLTFSNKAGDEMDAALTIANMGIIEHDRGNLELALQYYSRGLEIFERFEDQRFISIALNNIGFIYDNQGDLEKALEYNYRSLQIKEMLGYDLGIGYSRLNIGSILFKQNKLQEAFDSIYEAYQLFQKLTGNPDEISLSLFYLIMITIEMNDHESVEKYLKIIMNLHNPDDNKYIILRQKIVTGMYLLQRRRIKDLVESEKLFLEVLNHEIIDLDLTILALKYLCEIKILELKSIKNKDQILLETLELADKMHTIGEKGNSPAIIVEALLLQAKIQILTGNSKDALVSVEEASKASKEQNLYYLFRFIEQTEQFLDTIVDNLNYQDEFTEKLEAVKLENYIKYIRKMNKTK